MVNAIVLITVRRGRVNDVAQKLGAAAGVAIALGLVAVLRSGNNERVADLVTREIMDIEDIVNTETLLAFQVFSQYDLERMFSVGADG